MNPIGVGFIDLNAEGLFHFERLQLRAEFRCLAGWNAQTDLAAVSHGRLARNADSPWTVIEDPDISLVWIGPSAPPGLITAALTAGKHVLLGLPVGISSQDWRDWTGLGAGLCVAALHRWDGGFRTAKSVVDRGELGELIEVRRCSRHYVPMGLGLHRATDAPLIQATVAQQHDACSDRLKWFEFLDELLLLVPDRVTAVTSRPLRIGRGATTSNPWEGRTVWIEFASGCQGGLEFDRHSLAPLETGWILNGTQAGFSLGQRYQPTPDHELVDVPVEELPTEQDAFYDALVATIRDGADFPVTPESMLQVLEVMDLMESPVN